MKMQNYFFNKDVQKLQFLKFLRDLQTIPQRIPVQMKSKAIDTIITKHNLSCLEQLDNLVFTRNTYQLCADCACQPQRRDTKSFTKRTDAHKIVRNVEPLDSDCHECGAQLFDVRPADKCAVCYYHYAPKLDYTCNTLVKSMDVTENDE